jgi:hypothetical protein
MEVQSTSVEWVIQQLVGWVIEIIGGVASVGAGKDERLGDKATKATVPDETDNQSKVSICKECSIGIVGNIFIFSRCRRSRRKKTIHTRFQWQKGQQ